MALHGLAEMTLGVPRVDETRAFYEQFGLVETSRGVFATREGRSVTNRRRRHRRS